MIICKIRQRYLLILCQNALKFSPELWHVSLQLRKSYEYVTKRTRQSTKRQFLFSNQGYNRYLRVYPWALRLYHPSASMYSLRLRLRLYRSVPGWYNLNVNGQTRGSLIMSLSLTRVKQMVINGKSIKRAGNSTYSKPIMTTLVFVLFSKIWQSFGLCVIEIHTIRTLSS